MTAQSPLTEDTVVQRSLDVVEAEVDGEVVALNIEKGICYGLNKIGSRIWQLIAEPCRIADIGTRLMGEYDVDEETCRRQVIELLEDLRSEELITLVEGTSLP